MPDNTQLYKPLPRAEMKGMVDDTTDFASHIFKIASELYNVLTLWESKNLIPLPSQI